MRLLVVVVFAEDQTVTCEELLNNLLVDKVSEHVVSPVLCKWKQGLIDTILGVGLDIFLRHCPILAQ